MCVRDFLLLCVVAFGFANNGFSQNSMVVGTKVDKPSAILVLNPPDGNQGVLIPQITTPSRLLMKPSTPSEDGLLVFDITEKSFYFWRNSQWIKGLGSDDSQTLTYDPATSRLSLSNGATADLTTLKEIPSVAGQAGKYMITDGTTVSWGGPVTGSSGNLITTTPGVSVINGTNAVLGSGATITVQTASSIQPGLLSSADFNTFNNKVSTTSTPSAGDITGSYASGWQIAPNAVSNAEVSSLSPSKILAGAANQVLVTSGSVTTWANASTLAPGLTVSGDVTGALNATSVTKLQGTNISTTAPLNGQVLQYDQASGFWIPATFVGGSPAIAFKVGQTLPQLAGLGIPVQVLWDLIEQYDDGNNFSLSRFIAPSAGLYHFDVTVSVANIDHNDDMQMMLRVGSTNVQIVYANTGSNNSDVSATISTDVKLAANDIVTVWVTVPTGLFTIGQAARTQFSGRKIY